MRHVVLLAGLLALPIVAVAAPAASAFRIDQPWSRPTAQGANAAGFMSLTNTGKSADTLARVECAGVARAEIHQTSMANGVMSMKRLDAGLLVGAGQTVIFQPGGTHIMLIGVKTALKTGDKLPATLVFASGARAPVTFEVGGGPGMGADHQHHMGH